MGQGHHSHVDNCHVWWLLVVFFFVFFWAEKKKHNYTQLCMLGMVEEVMASQPSPDSGSQILFAFKDI